MKYSRLVWKLREQIHEFSGRLSPRFSVPKRRFIEEISGIQVKQDVKLSQIARSLEEDIPLRKTETRLSRILDAEGMDRKLMDSLIKMGAHRVHKDTLLVLDTTDLRKPYARHMKYLAKVRDGSTGEIRDGYAMIAVVACERDKERIVPLYHALYSADAPGHLSENEEMMKAVDAVREHCDGRGTWIIDRGGDRGKLCDAFVERGAAIIIRRKSDRSLMYQGKSYKACELVSR